MGAIEDFCTILKEGGQRCRSGEDIISADGQVPGLYESCLWWLESLDPDVRDVFYDVHLQRTFAGRLLRRGAAQYQSFSVGEHDGHFVCLMLWAPGAFTRPHNHMGSPARIQVLNPSGMLEQSRYVIGDEYDDFTSCVIGICRAGESIEEDAEDIHSVRNLTTSLITISLHDFVGDKGTMVFDLLGSKKKWIAKIGETAKPGVPSNAELIWKT